jgi:choice-of-anchor A domain-containing protein
MLRPNLAWLAALSLAFGFVTEARAGYVTNTLATAGPDSFGLLALYHKSTVQLNGPGTVVVGDVGIPHAPSILQLNSPPIAVQGNVYIGNGASIQNGSQVSGTIFTKQNDKLSQAQTDAFNASNTFAALAATQSVPGGQIANSMTLTGVAGINVLDVSNILLSSGQTLTLGGPAGAQWVINDAGGLLLSAASIVETGGVTTYDVVFNITGSSPVTTLGVLNNTVLNGVVLAPQSAVQLNGGSINGELIAGGSSIQLNAGASVHEGQDPSTPVTPAPSALVLMSLGAGGFVGLVIRSGYRRSVPA